MRAGRLDRRIQIERPDESVDAEGGAATVWIPYATVWADVLPIVAKERMSSPQTMAVRTAKIRIRYRRDITDQMRIRHDGSVWAIEGIAEFGRLEGLEIMASAIGDEP